MPLGASVALLPARRVRRRGDGERGTLFIGIVFFQLFKGREGKGMGKEGKEGKEGKGRKGKEGREGNGRKGRKEGKGRKGSSLDPSKLMILIIFDSF